MFSSSSRLVSECRFGFRHACAIPILFHAGKLYLPRRPTRNRACCPVLCNSAPSGDCESVWRWSTDEYFSRAKTYAPGQRNVAAVAQCFSRSRFGFASLCFSRGGDREVRVFSTFFGFACRGAIGPAALLPLPLSSGSGFDRWKATTTK